MKTAFAAASSIDQTSTIPILNLDATLRDATDDCPDTPGAPEDMATLIYTSGTTGVPTGVMLSHKAILWNAEGIRRFVEPLPSDVFLSLLPLAHAFERTLGYYLPMMTGSTVAYARSVETLRDDLGSADHISRRAATLRANGGLSGSAGRLQRAEALDVEADRRYRLALLRGRSWPRRFA